MVCDLLSNGKHIFIVPFLAALLLACNPLPGNGQRVTSIPLLTVPSAIASPVGTVSTEGFISETTAIDTARQIAMRGDGHLGGAVGSLTHLHAERASLATAQQRLAAQGWPSSGTEASDRMIWFVTMEGTWMLIGGPAAPITPVPASPPDEFHYLVVFLDAKTGADLGVAAH
jgi:hypothetical protein